LEAKQLARRGQPQTSGPGRALGQLARAPPPAAASSPTAAMDADVEREYGGRFLAEYNKKRLLGKGACGAVWLASSSRHGGAVALKQVAKGSSAKSRADERSANTEIAVGNLLFGPGGTPKVSPNAYPGIRYITRLLDAMETKKDLWMVMEYGGDVLSKALFEVKGEFASRGTAQPRERVYRVHHLPFYEAMKQDPRVFKRLVRQVLEAIRLLADHGIVHSDLKPENLLLKGSETEPLGLREVRLCDFGSSFMCDQPGQLVLATPEYMPPEALEACIGNANGSRRERAKPWSFDVWSLGAIMLELCYGVPHWLSYKCRVRGLDGAKDHSLVGLFAVPARSHERILQRQEEITAEGGLRRALNNALGVPLDADGFDLLEGMLQWDPEYRISPAEALDHPYLRED